MKATTGPRAAVARQRASFRRECQERCRPALLLLAGDAVEWLAHGILAAPWWKVL